MDANEKREREHTYVQLMAEKLWLDEYALWQAMPSVQRTTVSVGTIFVLWKMGADMRPDVEEAFKITGIELTRENGFRLCIQSQRFSRLDYSVTHQPMLLAGEPEVFVWIPFYQNVTYTPHPAQKGWVVRGEMCIRSRSHPREPVAGHTYLTQVGEFRARFRDFAEVRF